MSFVLLPPAERLCPICAVKHEPEQPHDPQSFYYKFHFAATWKRLPTWNDALAHCSEEVRSRWLEMLVKLEIDPSSKEVTGQISSQSELDKKLDEL